MEASYTGAEVTLTIDGDERDCRVRAFVLIEPDYVGVIGARLDGDADVWIGHDGWCPVDSVNLGPRDMEHIEEALCERAMENACGLDPDEYEEADE